MNKFKIEIASVDDRDNLVAEIWYEETMIAEINQEKDLLELELYNSKRSLFSLEEFIDILQAAKKELLYGARQG